VALIGRPNVGKSTLLNRIVGEKISIVTSKPQTTRNRILGIRTTERFQILFLDTPGIHRPKNRLQEIMLKYALATLEDADLILFLIDPVRKIREEDRFILNKLRKVTTPIYLIINKIDTIKKELILPLIDACRTLLDFREILPVSALKGDGVVELESSIVQALPLSPPYFPKEDLTDLSQRFMIAEMIREKILFRTRREIPYSVAVQVDTVRRRQEGKITDVEGVIYTEKESQKGILVGRGGRKLKEIGTLVRPEIEAFLDSKVFLRLWVKVRRDWRSQLRILREFGYE